MIKYWVLGSEYSRNLYKQQRQKKRLWNSATILVRYMGVANVRLANFPTPKNGHIFWPKNSTNFANLACSNISNILVSALPNEMVLLLLARVDMAKSFICFAAHLPPVFGNYRISKAPGHTISLKKHWLVRINTVISALKGLFPLLVNRCFFGGWEWFWVGGDVPMSTAVGFLASQKKVSLREGVT